MLREDNGLALCRGAVDVAGKPVLELAAGSDAPGERAKLEREFVLRDVLEQEWAARPMTLVTDGDRPVLLLSDPGGLLLSERVGGAWELGTFLRVGVGIARSLDRAHLAGLTHRDIKPGNILFDVGSGRAWLTGFGLAARPSVEGERTDAPELIVGTLAYMAPEQTGRVDRPVDVRSDLYALGVVFYQMLSGELPFKATDPLEWIHCHVARLPRPLCELRPSIPEAVADIVMKLLEKDAAERYQTASGLGADLQRCLGELESKGRIAKFRLGSSDRVTRLSPQDRLYGRETEVGSLLAAFDRVASTGATEVVLVSGYAGVGKSAVVNELFKAVASLPATAVRAKFDLQFHGTPYSSLADAFRGLLQALLAEQPAVLERWRELISEAIGVQGGLLIELMPELAAFTTFMQPQQAPSPLTAAEITLRFQEVFRRLLCVFARPGEPLIVFLDDLQWADEASLALIRYMAAHPDMRHSLLIGAYRDSEVRHGGPLASAIEVIRGGAHRTHELDLGPVSVGDVGCAVADALCVEPEAARALSVLVHQKAGGNPFFARQFLASLEEEGLLRFDPRTSGWLWDAARIGAKGLTVNAVELMVRRLVRLPAATREMLQTLACLGSQAHFCTLAIVVGSAEDLHGHLRVAVEAGVLLAESDRYRFVHDRAQEAAYGLIPEELRAEKHLRIGRLLDRAMTDEQRTDSIFDIANQVNAGRALALDFADRRWVAEINLQAGRKAKASAAHAEACEFLAAGHEALQPRERQACHELDFALRLERAECEISCAHLDEAEILLSELLDEARSDAHRARAITLRLELQLMRGEHDLAVRTAIAGLCAIGQGFPDHFTAEQVQAEYALATAAMADRTIESVADLPFLEDARMVLAMDIMVQLARASVHVNMNLFQALTLRLVTLTLKHGLSYGSVAGCSGVATFLGPAFQRYEDGVRFGKAAVSIMERGWRFGVRSGCHFALQRAVQWVRPVAESLHCLDMTQMLAKETGELLFVCYAMQHRSANLLIRGDALDEVVRQSAADLEFVERSKVRTSALHLASVHAFASAMSNRSPEAARAGDGELDARIRQGGIGSIHFLHLTLQMQRLFLMGDAEAALEIAANREFDLSTAQWYVQYVDFCVFQAIVIADRFLGLDAARRVEFGAVLEANRLTLERMSVVNSSSFGHKHALVAAVCARVAGRHMEALTMFEQAVESASNDGFPHDAALASELAGRFCLALGLSVAGRAHLDSARAGYLRWGAHAKVALMDAQSPSMEDAATQDMPPTIEASIEDLDKSVIVKVSQALSSEIVTDRLVEKLLAIAVEHAAADRGVLVLQAGGDWQLAAVASCSDGAMSIHRLERPVRAKDVPLSILAHVFSAHRSVALDDARVENAFSGDDYLRTTPPRSLLCLPFLNQGNLLGVLYLENGLASHVFTRARHGVLNILLSQAAISLQNAKLFEDLERENAERRESEAALRRSEERYALAVEAATDGHADWIADGDIFYASPRLREQWGLPGEISTTTRQQIQDAFPFHPDDRARVVELLNKHREGTSKRLEFDCRVVRREEIRWMHCTVLYLRDERGKLQRMSIATSDVTERMRAEEELRRSEERYALALAGTDEGVFDWDLLSDRMYVAPRTLEMLRIPSGNQWLSRAEWESFVEFCPGEFERIDAALRAHFDGKTSRYDEQVRLLVGGTEIRTFRHRGTVLRDASGVPYRMVGSVGDITHLKQQEEEVLGLKTRLLQAERFEAMGTLAGGIAHDFNNILGAILGFGERALRIAPEGSQQHHDLKNVVVAGERGRMLIGRVLSFSRGSAGERVPVHAERVVREVVDLLRAQLPSSIGLRTHLRSKRAAILGDAVQLHQLVMNLATNAVHAMADGGTMTVALRVVRISEARQARVGELVPGEWIVLKVGDEGCGVAPALMERIFDPFFTTRSEGVGTGLGLSLVQRIVTQWRGAVDVLSVPGQGSTFTVYLPRAADVPVSLPEATKPIPRGHGQRILVVDDEGWLLELTSSALRELGYEPVEFSAPREALEAFGADPDAFDALITDLRMPGMSGDELIRAIRSCRPLVPVILVSGYVGDASTTADSGLADEVLIKPLRTNALAESLARMFHDT